MRVVPVLNPGEFGMPGFALAFPASSVDQLAFQAGKAALGHGVVVGIPPDPMLGRTPISSQRLPNTVLVY